VADRISKEQDREYVLQHASLLAHMSDDDKMFPQALRDLRTAVAFYEAHERGDLLPDDDGCPNDD